MLTYISHHANLWLKHTYCLYSNYWKECFISFYDKFRLNTLIFIVHNKQDLKDNQGYIIHKETKAKVEKEAEEMFVRCAITDHERNDILNISCWSKLGNCQKVKNGCDSWSLSKEFLFFCFIFKEKTYVIFLPFLNTKFQ